MLSKVKIFELPNFQRALLKDLRNVWEQQSVWWPLHCWAQKVSCTSKYYFSLCHSSWNPGMSLTLRMSDLSLSLSRAMPRRWRFGKIKELFKLFLSWISHQHIRGAFKSNHWKNLENHFKSRCPATSSCPCTQWAPPTSTGSPSTSRRTWRRWCSWPLSTSSPSLSPSRWWTVQSSSTLPSLDRGLVLLTWKAFPGGTSFSSHCHEHQKCHGNYNLTNHHHQQHDFQPGYNWNGPGQHPRLPPRLKVFLQLYLDEDWVASGVCEK